jgi:ribosome biogenesis GTPase
MNLEKIGFNIFFQKQLEDLGIDNTTIARVIQEHKERYIISTFEKEYEAEITGNLRYSAKSREDFPSVGDWVQFLPYEENTAVIQQLIPRKTLLTRKSVSSSSEKQIIAANIDTAFVVQAVDRDFNLSRLERYVSLIFAGSIEPVVILNKTDLISKEELQDKLTQVSKRFKEIRIISMSNETLEGIGDLKNSLEVNKTYCLVGSSGVGKSSIINTLLNENKIKTNTISEITNKGKHTTTNRELILLDNGSIFIDTPGMREIGLTDNTEAIVKTFSTIEELSKNCKFGNCTHTDEPGCAILEALESGAVNNKEFENLKKLIRESEHFQASVAEKRKRDKEFGKMCKDIMKVKKKNKY